MQRIIKADAKEIVLETNGLMPITYQKTFKRDFFLDVKKIVEGKYDAEIISYMLWTFAKTADNSVPEVNKWLAGFEFFPLLDYITVVTEILTSALTAKTAEGVEDADEEISKKKTS